jgi:hypothetical protein
MVTQPRYPRLLQRDAGDGVGRGNIGPCSGRRHRARISPARPRPHRRRSGTHFPARDGAASGSTALDDLEQAVAEATYHLP